MYCFLDPNQIKPLDRMCKIFFKVLLATFYYENYQRKKLKKVSREDPLPRFYN